MSSNNFIKDNPIYKDTETDILVGAKQSFYDWTTSNNEVPYYDINLDEYLVTINTKQIKFDEQTLDRAKNLGLFSVLEFLNKSFTSDSYSDFLPLVKAERWYVSPRPGSYIKVLVQIPKRPLFETFPDKPTPDLNALKSKSFKVLAVEYLKFFSDIDELIEKILNIANFVSGWSGTITGIDFDREVQNVRDFISNIKQFFDFNSIDFNDPSIESVLLEMGFDEEDSIIFIALGGIPLLLGTNVLQQFRSVRSKRTIKYINSYQDILKLKDESWEDFINLFTDHPLSQILPTLKNAKKKVDQEIENIESGFKRGVKELEGKIEDLGILKNLEGVITSSQVKNAIRKAKEEQILTADFKFELSNKRKGERDYVGDQILVELDTVLPKINTVEDVFQEVLHRVDFRSLIAFMMDCLLPEIPEIPELPEIGDIKSFELPNFELPTINIPKLPTINLLAFIRLDLDKLLEVLLREALLAILRTVIDAIVAYCQGDNNIKDGDYGKTSIPTDNIPDNIVFISTGNDLDINIAKDFIDDVSTNLTPQELCALLLGTANVETEQALEEFLENEGVKYKTTFTRTQDILRFFKSMGFTLGEAAILRICRTTPAVPNDICLSEIDIETLNKNLYDIKRDRGEITEEQIQEQVSLIMDIKKNLVIDVVNSLENENYLEDMQKNIANKINNLAPQMPQGFSNPSDTIINNIFDNIESVYQSDSQAFFNQIRKEIDDESNTTNVQSFKDSLKFGIQINFDSLFNISSNIIEDLDKVQTRKHFQFAMNENIGDKLFSQGKTFGNIPENIGSVGKDRLINLQDLKIETKKAYQELPLSKKVQNSKFLNKLISEKIAKAYVRVYQVESLFKGIFSITSISQNNSLFSFELIRNDLQKRIQGNVPTKIFQLIFSEEFEETFRKEITKINQNFVDIFPDGYFENFSFIDINPRSLQEYISKYSTPQEFAQFTQEILTGFWIAYLNNRDSFESYFSDFQYFSNTKKILKETHESLNK